MKPLVSFVVPCYKLAHLLPECLNSILAQTYGDFEVLVMDNCSPDNTPEVVGSFRDPRVKHVRNDTNIGHIRNFNKGITMARGKYVWLVSADDFLTSPLVLRRYVDLMQRDHRVGYAFCRATAASGSKDSAKPLAWTDCGRDDRILRSPALVRRLARLNCIVMSSVMARKECYEEAGLFPLDLPYACDWYMWNTLALRHDVAYFAESMVCWRIHDESLTTSFERGEEHICITDEIDVLSRIGRQAALAGFPSLRRACNASMANRAAQAAKPNVVAYRTRAALSESELGAILRRKLRDPGEEADVRARFFIALGDAQFWGSECAKAVRSYGLAVKLRPWWPKSWIKYLLLRAGSAGAWVRRASTLLVVAARLKNYPGNPYTT